MMTGIFTPDTPPTGENARVKTNPRYLAASYTVMSVLSLALFVLNVCTHGTMLGLIGRGGLAVVGYNAYRAWFGKRRMNQRSPRIAITRPSAAKSHKSAPVTTGATRSSGDTRRHFTSRPSQGSRTDCHG